jgi:hypothetical protein
MDVGREYGKFMSRILPPETYEQRGRGHRSATIEPCSGLSLTNRWGVSGRA